MKKIVLVFILGIFIISCGDKKYSMEEKRALVIKSINGDEKAKQEIEKIIEKLLEKQDNNEVLQWQSIKMEEGMKQDLEKTLQMTKKTITIGG